MSRLRISGLFSVSFGLCGLFACSAPVASEDAVSQDQASVSDIANMVSRGDGTFDVTCHDGVKEIVSAADVQSGRVCTRATFPSSPFASGACTGTPMTAADASARLAAASGSPVVPGQAVAPVVIGSYVLGLRRRDTRYTWTRGHWDGTDVWVDAPNDTLSAWRDTGVTSSSGRRAVFSLRGTIELGADAAGAPYLRMVGEAANEFGPDTTRFLRLVSRPMRPWTNGQEGPSFELESRVAGGAWSRIDTEYGWSVQTTEYVLIGTDRSWAFSGTDVTAIVTARCGQFISARPGGGLSPLRAAIGIAMVLDAP